MSSFLPGMQPAQNLGTGLRPYQAPQLPDANRFIQPPIAAASSAASSSNAAVPSGTAPSTISPLPTGIESPRSLAQPMQPANAPIPETILPTIEQRNTIRAPVPQLTYQYAHPPVPEDKTPKLRGYQKVPVANYIQVLNSWPSVLNYTPLGGGKTYETCYMARYMFTGKILPMLIYAPKQTHAKWVAVAGMYGVPIVEINTYAGLRGTVKNQPNSIYVDRHQNPEKQADYTMKSSQNFANLLGLTPVLLVFDEISKVKNQSAQAFGAQALIRTICQNTDRGRIVLLSASPGNEPEHALNFHRMLCITHQSTYVDKEPPKVFGGRPKWYFTGLEDVKEWCTKQDPKVTQELWEPWYNNKWLPALRNSRASKPKTVIPILYELYINIVGPRLSFAGPAPPVRAIIRNGFFLMDEQTQMNMKRAVDLLSGAAQIFLSDEKGKGSPIKAIVRAMIALSRARLPIIERITVNSLVSDPNLKVILFFNYYDSVDYMIEVAKRRGFPYVEYSGRIKIVERNRNLQRFQENNNDIRLLIATTGAGDMGIDMDDKFGGHPRLQLQEPSYDFISLYQATGRAARDDSKSVPRIFMVYGRSNNTAIEKELLDNIARKTNVSRTYTPGSTGIPYPGEYLDYFEQYEANNPTPWLDIATDNAQQEINALMARAANN